MDILASTGRRHAEPPSICVVGTTASGKSALALEIAERFGGEIISTDSMQVYRNLDIGTAKPSRAERARVPHHLIDVADPDADFSAGRYVALAQAALADLARRSRVPVLCGGTGLYFRALMEGLAEVPPVPDAVKREVQAFAERAGVAACQAELRRVDPALAAQVHPHHASRILRALEVFRATGRPLSEYQRDTPFRAMSENVLYVGIAWERRALWTRIEARVHEMLAAGWVDEVRGLLARGYAPTLKPLRGIGYKEIVAHLQGTRDAASLAPDIAIHTRQYAKRQMTWFRRDVHIAWCSPGDTARLLRRVERHLTHA